MKKFVTFAAVVLDPTQPCGPMTDAVRESFRREFKDASQVRWVKIKDVFQARFYHRQEYCLAFFSASGRLLMNGRKMPFDRTPSPVIKEMEKIRHALERKHDNLMIAGVYELHHSGRTRYFVNLESEYLSLSVLTVGGGHSEILKNVNHERSVIGKSLIGSHYPGACG